MCAARRTFLMGDNATRFKVYELCLVMFAVLIVYAVPWLKIRKQAFFKPVPVEKAKCNKSGELNEKLVELLTTLWYNIPSF